MLQIFLLMVFFIFLGCSDGVLDAPPAEVTQPARIINKTDSSVVLEAKWTDYNGVDSLSYIIKAGDTLNIYRNQDTTFYIPVRECGLYAQSCENEAIDVRLIFQNDGKKCLLFKGALQENDIRTINSFDEYNFLQEDVGVNVHLYEYFITETHLNKAEVCE